MENNNNNKKRHKKSLNLKRKANEESYVVSQIDFFGHTISEGFSDHSWTNAARIFNSLQGHLLQSDREKLAEIWRDAFAGSSKEQILTEIELIKEHIRS
jgi:hypothetical protein